MIKDNSTKDSMEPPVTAIVPVLADEQTKKGLKVKRGNTPKGKLERDRRKATMSGGLRPTSALKGESATTVPANQSEAPVSTPLETPVLPKAPSPDLEDQSLEKPEATELDVESLLGRLRGKMDEFFSLVFTTHDAFMGRKSLIDAYDIREAQRLVQFKAASIMEIPSSEPIGPPSVEQA